MNDALLGCSKDDLDTPALCVDLDAFESNIRDVAATCRENNVGWRPHTKCHKSPAIAQKLLEAGAMGVTCAKLGEAEVMAEGGVQDILIANLLAGAAKVRRLVDLRRRADPIICVDHLDQATPISRAMTEAGLTVRTFIEVDIGLERAGTACGDATISLAKSLADLPGISLCGLMGYEGHLLVLEDQAEKEAKILEALASLVHTKELVEQAGVSCPMVSCGGTGSYFYSVKAPGITELQPGGAIFMDAFYRHRCRVPDLKYALTVLTTVVGREAPDRALIDAGRKTVNQELHPPLVVGRDGIVVDRLSAEHGALRLAPSARDLAIGDRVELIPGYSDLTCVLHDRFYGFRKGKLETIWPLTGRGRLQ